MSTATVDVLLMKIVYGLWERSAVGNWLADCYCRTLQRRVPVRNMIHGEQDTFPVYAARNLSGQVFMGGPFDVLFMVDADMHPAAEFFQRATEYFATHRAPALIGSPYRMRAPGHEIAVEHGGGRFEPRDAIEATGLRKVCGIGTGLVAINRAAFEVVKPPWFDLEFTDEFKSRVKIGEDIGFCRKLIAAGGTVLCDWDSWSGHAKTEIVGKPEDPKVELAVSIERVQGRKV
jgi:hypothetical protein